MPPATPAGPPRPLRSDAKRNRARILRAAEEVFAAGGPSASTEDVARRAEVAVGTIFRHFPTKAALIEAVFIERLCGLTEQADALSTAEDASAAFFGFFAEAVQQATVKHMFTDAIDDGDEGIAAVHAAIATAGESLRAALHTLLRRAQHIGAVRPDLTIDDLIGLLIGGARAVEHVEPDPGARARMLAVLSDGLRPVR